MHSGLTTVSCGDLGRRLAIIVESLFVIAGALFECCVCGGSEPRAELDVHAWFVIRGLW